METPQAAFLGLLDEPVSGRPLNLETSFIGGMPIWPPELAEAVGGALSCALCERSLLLVAQLYCPVGLLPDQRVLYVFCCGSASCASDPRCWRAYRVQHPAAAAAAASVAEQPRVTDAECKLVECGAGRDRWLDLEDDWADEPSSSAAADGWSSCTVVSSAVGTGHRRRDDPCEDHSVESVTSTDMDALANQLIRSEICDGPAAVCDAGSSLATAINPMRGTAPEGASGCFEPYYLAVLEDEQAADFIQGVPQCAVERLLQEYHLKEGRSSDIERDGDGEAARSGGSGETYEKGNLKHGDWQFHHFLKVLSGCPEQLIRYSYGGQPVLARNQTSPVPACGHCGGPRTYELQLMPALGHALVLRGGTTGGTERPVDVCTVLVFSCAQNCWPSPAAAATQASRLCREEVVVVQCEPDREKLATLERQRPTAPRR